MRERIVVCFRVELPQARGDATGVYLERAQRIREHAEALGGSLCAWSGLGFAFELLPESLEKALVLVGQACDEVASGMPAWSFGISQGEMSGVAEAGPLSTLGWGAPLVVATALAGMAQPGEVLLDPALPALEGDELPLRGHREGTSGGRYLRGLILDPLYVPSVATGPTTLAPEARPKSLLPSRTTLPPSQSSGPERRIGMEALSKGDTKEALVALSKGVAKTKSAPPVERARALLAHGIALAATGREREALLEVLEALARAREAEDARGEEACARFLAKLAEAAGQPEAALTWKQVAQTAQAAG